MDEKELAAFASSLIGAVRTPVAANNANNIDDDSDSSSGIDASAPNKSAPQAQPATPDSDASTVSPSRSPNTGPQRKRRRSIPSSQRISAPRAVFEGDSSGDDTLSPGATPIIQSGSSQGAAEIVVCDERGIDGWESDLKKQAESKKNDTEAVTIDVRPGNGLECDKNNSKDASPDKPKERVKRKLFVVKSPAAIRSASSEDIAEVCNDWKIAAADNDRDEKSAREDADSEVDSVAVRTRRSTRHQKNASKKVSHGVYEDSDSDVAPAAVRTRRSSAREKNASKEVSHQVFEDSGSDVAPVAVRRSSRREKKTSKEVSDELPKVQKAKKKANPVKSKTAGETEKPKATFASRARVRKK